MYRKEIKKYAEEVRRQNESVLLRNRQKYSKFWDLPACVSICYGTRKGVFAKGYSHMPNGTIWHPTLKKRLDDIGQIGYPTHLDKNILGRCAEQHSGNNYMKKAHENHLKNLNFSITIRPRTGQTIDFCNNCKEIFPNL